MDRGSDRDRGKNGDRLAAHKCCSRKPDVRPYRRIQPKTERDEDRDGREDGKQKNRSERVVI